MLLNAKLKISLLPEVASLSRIIDKKTLNDPKLTLASASLFKRNYYVIGYKVSNKKSINNGKRVKKIIIMQPIFSFISNVSPLICSRI